MWYDDMKVLGVRSEWAVFRDVWKNLYGISLISQSLERWHLFDVSRCSRPLVTFTRFILISHLQVTIVTYCHVGSLSIQ